MMIGPFPAIHPGDILREEFLTPMGLTSSGVAAALVVPRARMEQIARAQAPVTADIARRLGRHFGTGPEFWLNLQVAHDLAAAAEDRAPLTPHPAPA
ncbi:HigA family addiction module antitoxin [Xanthobacter agilis]|uniref:HigA family addiction module antitoxin n=1 Tax=Xanthobacter agilis TaxID=47492 RepID=UPI00372CA639